MNAVLPILLCCGLLAACSTPSPPAPPVVGGDRDSHGCIGSAGYRWCTRSGQCERPWELAKAQGLDNTAAAIDAYCATPAPATPQTR
ncbi:peptidase [Stenotrophomonas sp. LGBM10]|uniref:peptidase n=1 Tax=Stenotrophomonas sp. LGBM10 TaxID=3390038 RepID=UPI00398BB3F2